MWNRGCKRRVIVNNDGDELKSSFVSSACALICLGHDSSSLPTTSAVAILFGESNGFLGNTVVGVAPPLIFPTSSLSNGSLLAAASLSAVGGIFDYWPQRLLPKWRHVTNRKDSRELTRLSSPLLTSLANVNPHIRREDRWSSSRLSRFHHRHYRRQHAFRPERYFRFGIP